MKSEEYEQAANYWDKKDKDSIQMEPQLLKQEMEKYILANNTCALATGAGDFVRCTPIEYTYCDEKFWMFSEGGLKFKALKNNKNVCLAIYDKYEGFGKLRGMQVSGVIEIIEPFSEAYVKAAEVKKIPVDMLKKLDHPMNLLCVHVTEIEFLNSDFKQQGYGSRQKMIF